MERNELIKIVVDVISRANNYTFAKLWNYYALSSDGDYNIIHENGPQAIDPLFYGKSPTQVLQSIKYNGNDGEPYYSLSHSHFTTNKVGLLISSEHCRSLVGDSQLESMYDFYIEKIQDNSLEGDLLELFSL